MRKYSYIVETVDDGSFVEDFFVVDVSLIGANSQADRVVDTTKQDCIWFFTGSSDLVDDDEE